MNDVPPALAREVAEVAHDEVVLRLRPVFAPADGLVLTMLGSVGFLVTALLVFPGLLMLPSVVWLVSMLGQLLLVLASLEPLRSGLLLLLAGIGCAMSLGAIGALAWRLRWAVDAVHAVDLALGAHAIRITTWRRFGRTTEVVRLVDLLEVRIEPRGVLLRTRDGWVRAPVGERSSGTMQALNTWLATAAARAKTLGHPVEVPTDLQRLQRAPTGTEQHRGAIGRPAPVTEAEARRRG